MQEVLKLARGNRRDRRSSTPIPLASVAADCVRSVGVDARSVLEIDVL